MTLVTEKSKLLTRQVRWQKEHPDRRRAHEIVSRAVRSGRLVKPVACEDCGTVTKLDGHHERYDAPLDVQWLCRRCHSRRHTRKIVGTKRRGDQTRKPRQTVTRDPVHVHRAEFQNEKSGAPLRGEVRGGGKTRRRSPTSTPVSPPRGEFFSASKPETAYRPATPRKDAR